MYNRLVFVLRAIVTGLCIDFVWDLYHYAIWRVPAQILLLSHLNG